MGSEMCIRDSPDGLVFIETQTGICEEDDIIRLEDDYGRIDTKQYS